MKQYKTLQEVHEAIQNRDEEILTYDVYRLRNHLQTLSPKDQVTALEHLHIFYNEEFVVAIQEAEETQQELTSQEEKEVVEKLLTTYQWRQKPILKRLERLPKLQQLAENDTILPCKKGKSYKVKAWNDTIFFPSGSTTQYINSSKVKVLENSLFQNEYDLFSIDMKEDWINQINPSPYVKVRVSYGIYKGENIFIRQENLDIEN